VSPALPFLLRTAGIPKCGKDTSNQGRIFGIAALRVVCSQKKCPLLRKARALIIG
jgi:hypothetical protein